MVLEELVIHMQEVGLNPPFPAAHKANSEPWCLLSVSSYQKPDPGKWPGTYWSWLLCQRIAVPSHSR